MAEKADVSALPLQSGMLASVDRSVLGHLVEIDVENHVSVEHDFDASAVDGHLLAVPLAGGKLVSTLRSGDAVGGAVVLPGPEIRPLFVFVVDDLQLDPLVRRVAGACWRDSTIRPPL